MRRIVLATSATLAILILGSFVPSAEAMTFASPGSILQASADGNLVQEVACRKLYRCGPYGCDWRAVCWNDPAVPIPARITTATTAPSTMATAVSIIITVASHYVGPVPIDPMGTNLNINTAKAFGLKIALTVVGHTDALIA
jgi:hypothetical protein